MSRQPLIPTNVFCRQADPLPPVFPLPREGDVYYNTFSHLMRVYTEGQWQNLTTPGWLRWTGTQAEYDAIPVKDPDVLYVIV